MASFVGYHLTARIKERAWLEHVSEDVNSKSKAKPPSAGRKHLFFYTIEKKNRQKRYMRLSIQLKMHKGH